MDKKFVFCLSVTNCVSKLLKKSHFYLTGKVKLEPAKPIERKSVLNQKLGQLPSEPLPPIPSKPKNEDKSANNKNATAFQVVFDENSDGVKTKKYSKFSSMMRPNKSKLPSQKIDDR